MVGGVGVHAIGVEAAAEVALVEAAEPGVEDARPVVDVARLHVVVQALESTVHRVGALADYCSCVLG